VQTSVSKALKRPLRTYKVFWRADMRIRLEPVGMVKNEFVETVPDGWESTLSQIAVAEKWAPALDGLEGFSHLIILFWLNRIPRRRISLHIHPEARQDLPLVGLFATRTRLGRVRIFLERAATRARCSSSWETVPCASSEADLPTVPKKRSQEQLAGPRAPPVLRAGSPPT